MDRTAQAVEFAPPAFPPTHASRPARAREERPAAKSQAQPDLAPPPSSPTYEPIERRLSELARSPAVVTLDLVFNSPAALRTLSPDGETWERVFAAYLTRADSERGRVVSNPTARRVQVECPGAAVAGLRALGLPFRIVRVFELPTADSRSDRDRPAARPNHPADFPSSPAAADPRRSRLLRGAEQLAQLLQAAGGLQAAALLPASVAKLAGQPHGTPPADELKAWVEASENVLRSAGLYDVTAFGHPEGSPDPLLRAPTARARAKALMDKAVAALGASGYLVCMFDPLSEDDYRVVLHHGLRFPEMVSGFGGFGSSQWGHTDAAGDRKKEPVRGDGVVICTNAHSALRQLPMNRWFISDRAARAAYRKLVLQPGKEAYGPYFVREGLTSLAYLDGWDGDRRCLSVYLNFVRPVVIGNPARAYLRGLRNDLMALYPQFRNEFCEPVDSRLPARLLRTCSELASLGETPEATFESKLRDSFATVRDYFRQLRATGEVSVKRVLHTALKELGKKKYDGTVNRSIKTALRKCLSGTAPKGRGAEYWDAVRDCVPSLWESPDALHDALRRLGRQKRKPPPTEPFDDAVAVCLRRFLENVLELLGVDRKDGFATLNGFHNPTYVLYPVARAGNIRPDPRQHHMKELATFAGRGAVAWVALHRRPILIPNVKATHLDGLYLQIDRRVKSELAVPLLAGGDLVGVLNVESHRENAFTPSQLTLLSLVAPAVAIAWRGCMRRKLVFGLADLFAPAGKPSGDTALREWCAWAKGTFRADDAYVWGVEERKGGVLEYRSVPGPSHATTSKPRQDGWTSYVHRTKRIVFLTDITPSAEGYTYRALAWNDAADGPPQWEPVPAHPTSRTGFRSEVVRLNPDIVSRTTFCLMGVPLLRNGDSFGVLWLDYHHPTASSPFNSRLIRDTLFVPVPRTQISRPQTGAAPPQAERGTNKKPPTLPTRDDECTIAFNPECVPVLKGAVLGSLNDRPPRT